MALFIRTIGVERGKAKVGLVNIDYNIKRLNLLRTLGACGRGGHAILGRHLFPMRKR